MRKIFIVLIILLLCAYCSSISNASDYDIGGLWHIHGEGFAEKGFVRVSLELLGSMNLTTQAVGDIRQNLKEVVSNELTVKVDPAHDEWLKDDMKALTEYNVNLRLNATQLDIKAWEKNLPNGIKIPVLLPEMRPTVNDPFVFPAYTYDDIRYQITITGADSGTLRLNGYIDVDTVGRCELNADCSIWKDGSSEPSRAEESSSGCNSGLGTGLIFMLLILPGVIKRVWN